MNYTLGESLLDVIFSGIDQVVAKPGGSMLNAAVSMARMGLGVSHISEVGDNEVARILLEFLQQNNIDISHIKQYQDTNTSVALAFLDKDKKPSYQFVNAYPEKRTLSSVPKFKAKDVLLFGSIYSLSSPIRKELLEHLQSLIDAGGLLIYDPNIRHKHHLEVVGMYDTVLENMRLSHIIKASDEDCENIFGTGNPETYLEKISSVNPDALIFLTLGAKGAMAHFKQISLSVEAIDTNVVSTIGAGDGFNAGVLFAINQLNINQTNLARLNEKQIKIMLSGGIQTAAKVCASYDNYIPMANADV